MNKFQLDYKKLSNSISFVEEDTYKYADVKHRLEKVAFDIFKFKDSNSDELWQVQSADDGEYIVCKYETDEPEAIEVKASAKPVWDVLVGSGDINIFYKGQPIAKMACKDLGLGDSDLKTIKHFLPNKLATDKNFVKALLASLDAKDEILQVYPELSL